MLDSTLLAMQPGSALATTHTLAPLLYPFTLGLIATVNPCGFPLLPVYLNLFVGNEQVSRPPAERAARGIVAGALATAGFVALFGSIGIVVELGISTLYGTVSAWSRWLMVGTGLAMVVMGVMALIGRPLRLRLPEVRPGVGLRRPLLLLVFGVAYGVASLGCALPLFLGGVAGAFTRSGTVIGLSSFIAYALGMGFLFTVLAVAMALTGSVAIRRLRGVSRIVPVLGGVLLIVVGAYLTLYWTTDIIEPATSSLPERAVASLQSWIANLLGDHAATVGAVLGVIIVGSLFAYAVQGKARIDPGQAQSESTSADSTGPEVHEAPPAVRASS